MGDALTLIMRYLIKNEFLDCWISLINPKVKSTSIQFNLKNLYIII